MKLLIVRAPWIFVSLFVGLSLAPSLVRAESPWQELGPDGGEITSFLVDSATPGRLFAGTRARGVFVSDDGGDVWRLTGLNAGAVQALAQGHAPERLYAAVDSDILVSADDGRTWTSTGFEPVLGAKVLAVDGEVAFAGAFDGLFRLEAGGWVRIAPTVFRSPTNFFDLLQVPGGPLYVATLHGLFESKDQGETFRRLGIGVFDEASRIVRDPLTAALFVRSSRPYGLFQSNAARTEWHNVTETLPGGPNPGAFTVQAVAGHRVVFALKTDGLYRAELPATTWELVSDVPYERFGSDRLEAAAANPSTLYAPGLAGVARSEDGGHTWALASHGLHGLALDAYALGDPAANTLYASSQPGTLFGSTDAAEHWDLLDQPIFSVEAPLAVDPTDPETVYRGVPGGVERSTDGGHSWTPSEEVLECNEIYTLEVAPSLPSTLYAAGYTLTSGCSLSFPETCFSHRSTDSGRTWQCTAPLGFVLRFVVDPRNDLWVYALESERLLRSEDGGDTWEEIAGDLDGLFADLQLHPGRPDILFLAAWDQVYRSYDRGDTWETTGGAPPATISALAVHPVETRNLYTLAGGQLYISTDQGASWLLYAGPGEGLELTGPLVIPRDQPGYLYVGTTGGVVRRRIPVKSECVSGPETLCLADGRFQVDVTWRDFQDRTGVGTAVEITGDTGAFWFFRETNLEMLVKVLDGRPVNGYWWVFFGSLSNVEFDLRVTDTQSGDVREYHNPLRTFASRGDTLAFSAVSPTTGFVRDDLASAAEMRAFAESMRSTLIELPTAVEEGEVRSLADPEDTTCVSDPTTLCLRDRFRIRVRWEDFQHRRGDGMIRNLTADTGAFWFFRETNLELMVKILDGRPVNGHWWVFFGSLTNVAFTVTVDDLVAGTTIEYLNPARTFASRGDTGAF